MGYKRQSPQPVVEGGTGVQSNTAYAVLCGGTTGTGAIQSIASVGTSGQVLTSNGAGALPTFQASSGGGVVITQFTASGTWTKDANAQWVTVFGWGGGSGGGSGRRATSTTSGGGGAGSTGGFFFWQTDAANWGATEAVTIGAGGSGGATQTVNDTNGNNGTQGGATTIGDLNAPINSAGLILTTGFGNGGLAGTSQGGDGPQGYTNATRIGLTQGSNGTVTNGSTPANGFGTQTAGSGGGGAGADSVTPRTGGTGQTISTGGTVLVTGGAGGVETGTINGGNGSAGASGNGVYSGGSGGGGGGGQSSGGSAGTGGNGGIPGGAGGGGGGSLNGTNSGAGGDGARGELWVIEFLG